MSAINKINDIHSLKRFIPLNELEHDKLSELIENSSVLNFKKAQLIYSGIEKSHSVYLLSGNVVRAPNTDQAQLIKASSSHACQAIMSPDNRCRMVAENNVTVLCVDAELLDFLLNWGADDGVVVDEINTDEADEWVDGLLRSETILSLSPQSIQTLMTVVEPVEIKANEMIFNQGDEPDYYYIVSRGHCVVTRRAEGEGVLTELARLGPGDAFGEEALIANTARSATVRMLEDGLLLRLDQRNFKKLLEQSLVNTITAERAKRLKAKDAVVLDLRSAAAFSRDGSGINIPFSELRSRIGSLDKEGKYIVVSDDNNLSAVGAFLLSKKRFKVYLLKTVAKEGQAARTAEVDAQAKQLEATISQLQQQLSQVNARFHEEQKNHSASKVRIQFLESGLKETEDGARKAILEASALKNRSESFLRGRVNALVSELEMQKQSSRQLSVDNEALKSELESVQGKIEQVQGQAEFKSVEVSEAQTREASLYEQIKQLQQSLEGLQQAHEQVLSEKQLLSNQLSELSQQAEHKATQMNAVQEKLQTASGHLGSLEDELQALQVRHAELEISHEQGQAEKQSLNNLLNEAIQTAEQQTIDLRELQTQLHSVSDSAEQAGQAVEDLQTQKTELESRLEQELEEQRLLNEQLNDAAQKAGQQTAELEAMHDQLNTANSRADQAEQSLQVSQEQLAEVEGSLELSRQVNQQAKQQFRQQERLNVDQEKKIALLTEDLRLQTQTAQQQQSSLQHKLGSAEEAQVEEKSQFFQAESSYKQQIDQLESELNQAVTDAKQISELASRQTLQNQALSEELSILRGENKRSGLMVKSLSFVLLMLIVSVGTAYYMGIDLHNEASVLMEQAATHVNKLFDVISE